jgi:cold shock CspA family protein
MKLGGVIKVITENGYGFIASDDRRDYFVHAKQFAASGIPWPPTPGTRIRFDTMFNQRTRKLEAIDIELVRDAA